MHCPSLPAIAHDLHVPLHAVAQQSPCSQCADAHSPAAKQGAPGGLGPQLPLTQAAPATQSALVVHTDRQLPAELHKYCPHESTAADAQVPSPSQRAACVTVEAAQDCG
jgi:hypothetical protein